MRRLPRRDPKFETRCLNSHLSALVNAAARTNADRHAAEQHRQAGDRVTPLVADRHERVGRELRAGQLLGRGVVHVAERALGAVTEQPPLAQHRQDEQRDRRLVDRSNSSTAGFLRRFSALPPTVLA